MDLDLHCAVPGFSVPCEPAVEWFVFRARGGAELVPDQAGPGRILRNGELVRPADAE
ncbi:MAG: hypothetical protein H6895_02795 [Defluviimonas sp.]|uniref:hypothetical protein n=1 Tax=Albidovulum sp. TaxID=1872424 RepID=UPI002A343D26|nr:hypothetical protein [Defluviimonas sp.]